MNHLQNFDRLVHFFIDADFCNQILVGIRRLNLQKMEMERTTNIILVNGNDIEKMNVMKMETYLKK